MRACWSSKRLYACLYIYFVHVSRNSQQNISSGSAGYRLTERGPQIWYDAQSTGTLYTRTKQFDLFLKYDYTQTCVWYKLILYSLLWKYSLIVLLRYSTYLQSRVIHRLCVYLKTQVIPWHDYNIVGRGPTCGRETKGLFQRVVLTVAQ